MHAYRKHLRNPKPESLGGNTTDQERGVTPPPIEKPIEAGAKRIDLAPVENLGLGRMPLAEAIRNRHSRRTYDQEALSAAELSFLLWATQGIRRIHPERIWAMRTVPSGGCRHPFETYLAVRAVEGVGAGLYRYSALHHQLVEIRTEHNGPSLGDVCYGQRFVDTAAVSFIWTAIPYRSEWRYGQDSLKDILLSCGHICQNLYLACESIDAGTCAIVAYDQDLLDAYLGVDGLEEISLYLAPVGKVLGDRGE